mgnify:CR=1 FL=1
MVLLRRRSEQNMVSLSWLLKVEFITVKPWILVDANLPCSSMRTDSMSIQKCGSLHRVKKKNAKPFGSFDRPRTKNQQTNKQRQYKQINKNKFWVLHWETLLPGTLLPESSNEQMDVRLRVYAVLFLYIFRYYETKTSKWRSRGMLDIFPSVVL